MSNSKKNKDKLTYQVEKSIKAYQSGGYFGKGPGEGIVKKNIPDAHEKMLNNEHKGGNMAVLVGAAKEGQKSLN